ncbi:hypothetical protein A0257_22705 (plasmid) [Hymenobacter psoromatis]|nr:hypothetical protein A0257_22705 [Hymenobacter psoromatis]
MSAAPVPSHLPFALTPEAQRAEALLAAHQALAAAFPPYPYARWRQALEALQLPVQPGPAGEPARLTPQGLVQLLHYLAAPAEAAAASPAPPAGPLPPVSLSLGGPIRKQTYSLPQNLIERLARVSHWKHYPINQVVVLALTQLVDRHPEEAARPLPPTPTLS